MRAGLERSKPWSKQACETTQGREHLLGQLTPGGVALSALGLAALGAVLAVTFYHAPDFVRYLKIRQM